jgi:hypothetical protein
MRRSGCPGERRVAADFYPLSRFVRGRVARTQHLADFWSFILIKNNISGTMTTIGAGKR